MKLMTEEAPASEVPIKEANPEPTTQTGTE